MNPVGGQTSFAAVILAAGYSSRMKLWKPEILLNKIPLIIRVIVSAAHVCEQIIVVGGYQFEKLKALVRDDENLGKSEKNKIVFVENVDVNAGMFSSVKIGVKQVHSSIDGIFVVPGDMPFVRAETYKKLADTFEKKSIIDVFMPGIFIDSGGETKEKRLKKGHPILIRRPALSAVLQEKDDSILRNVLQKYSSEVCLVEDRGICIDIDDESDLAKYGRLFELNRT
ncbi:MAG: nucleotidyltransferase family protein [Bacteroidota bacterium]